MTYEETRWCQFCGHSDFYHREQGGCEGWVLRPEREQEPNRAMGKAAPCPCLRAVYA